MWLSRHISIIYSLFALATLVIASQWDNFSATPQPGAVIRRQGGSDEPTQTDKQDATDAPASKTSDSTETADTTDGPSKSDSDSKKKTGKESGKDKSTSVDDRLPPGGIKMVSPSANAEPTYIKIGDHATFKWNYTSLSVTPSAIDVVAYCSRNDHYYTIAGNESVSDTGDVTWDTGKFATGTAPLLTETYTLMVYDVELGPSEIAPAGHLGSSNQFTFGMYVPQKYTPLSEYKCATCSSAISDVERQAIQFMFGMVAITILSFTWFVGGFWHL